mmetsp:Transcript_70011/g.81633  ORF Transcript_70011/g.81633 Transcript_70011/m.81633 type:complete len:252 (+) Transcript_70011:50-805(+)|eukprot:CAMPEP_0176462986 /NCGR_PEP_ID=MMETSP0127-20121128/35599_1 /TAXON_ID=938130 /ORGANISM="Platyophrya macrostoma, Strain WH" /LENGTH=251 /DNA_ID=CAMNT_0017855019 /DNA_START=42 /DNA_END=797 /DNA_ORIENTATION=-
MPLIVSRDSLESKQTTLVGLVELCQDCVSYCREKTERYLENRSRAPRGWETEYEAIAAERRKEDAEKCEAACRLVQRGCPTVEKLQAYDAYYESMRQSRSSTAAGVPPPSLPTIQEVSRCEHAAERFASVLFAISQKPTKVHFDSVNPKTGEMMREGADEEASSADGAVAGDASKVAAAARAAGKKPMDKAAIQDEILKRWSTSRRERINMEELGVIRTGEETMALKQQMARDQQMADRKTAEESGTVPKW